MSCRLAKNLPEPPGNPGDGIDEGAPGPCGLRLAGHSREVAQDHYLMVTDEDYAGAAGSALQNPVQSGAARGPHEPSGQKEKAVSPAIAKDTAVQIPPRGVEPRFSD